MNIIRVIIAIYFAICDFAQPVNPGRVLQSFDSLPEQLQELKNIGQQNLVLSTQQKLIHLSSSQKPASHALRQILQSKRYRELFTQAHIQIDGNEKDWLDSVGNFEIVLLDRCIRELKHSFDRQTRKLYVLWKLGSRRQCMDVWKKRLPAVELSWVGAPGSPVILSPINAAPGAVLIGGREHSTINMLHKAGKNGTILEAVFEIDQIFSQRPQIISLRPVLINRFFNEPVFLTDRKSIQPLEYQNHALFIYLRLLQRKLYDEDDPIRAAIALASARIYTQLEPGARSFFFEELVRRLNWYEDCIFFQRNNKLDWNLSGAGLLAKMLWSDPTNAVLVNQGLKGYQNRPWDKTTMSRLLRLTEHDYELRQILLERSLITKSSLETKALVERFVRTHMKFRGPFLLRLPDSDPVYKEAKVDYLRDIEQGKHFKLWAGRQRGLHQLNFLSFQLSHFSRTGNFLGDEITIQELTAAFLKSVGLVPLALQRQSTRGEEIELLLFDASTKSYRAASRFRSVGGKELVSWSFYGKHPWLPLFPINEEAKSTTVERSIEQGISASAIELVFHLQENEAFLTQGQHLFSN